MRLPAKVDIKSRDGTLDRDTVLMNLGSDRGDRVIKRPAMVNQGVYAPAGQGFGAFWFNDRLYIWSSATTATSPSTYIQYNFNGNTFLSNYLGGTAAYSFDDEVLWPEDPTQPISETNRVVTWYVNNTRSGNVPYPSRTVYPHMYYWNRTGTYDNVHAESVAVGGGGPGSTSTITVYDGTGAVLATVTGSRSTNTLCGDPNNNYYYTYSNYAATHPTLPYVYNGVSASNIGGTGCATTTASAKNWYLWW